MCRSFACPVSEFTCCCVHNAGPRNCCLGRWAKYRVFADHMCPKSVQNLSMTRLLVATRVSAWAHFIHQSQWLESAKPNKNNIIIGHSLCWALRVRVDAFVTALDPCHHISKILWPNFYALELSRAHTDRSLLYTFPGGEPSTSPQMASLQQTQHLPYQCNRGLESPSMIKSSKKSLPSANVPITLNRSYSPHQNLCWLMRMWNLPGNPNVLKRTQDMHPCVGKDYPRFGCILYGELCLAALNIMQESQLHCPLIRTVTPIIEAFSYSRSNLQRLINRLCIGQEEFQKAHFPR